MLKNTHQIPVINSEVNMHKNQIVDALEKYGFFFYPINNGLEEIVQSTFNLSKSFFSLPLEDKISCGQAAGNDTGRVSGYYSTAEYEHDSSYSGDIKEAFQLLKNFYSHCVFNCSTYKKCLCFQFLFVKTVSYSV